MSSGITSAGCVSLMWIATFEIISALLLSSSARVYCPCVKSPILKERVSLALHRRRRVTPSESPPDISIS